MCLWLPFEFFKTKKKFLFYSIHCQVKQKILEFNALIDIHHQYLIYLCLNLKDRPRREMKVANKNLGNRINSKGNENV